MRRPSIPICTLLAVFLLTNVAFALGYFYLTGTLHFGVTSPYVQFYRWSDGTKSKTIDMYLSITPDEWTVVDNATYGIINGKNGVQECGFYIESMSVETGRPANLTVHIVNATDIKAIWTTTTWLNIGEGFAVPFTMEALEKATIKIWLLASSDAVDCVITFKIRVPSEGV